MGKELSIPFLEEYIFDMKHEVSFILIEWKKVKEQLEVLYRERDQKNTLDGMKKGVSLFIHYLFWTNEQPINSTKSITLDVLEVKPVNLEERIGFIIARPNLYHSFRQLSELMTEQEKLFAKKNILKKASKPKG
ncbi:YpoC family protein [Neobacillus sp. K501]